MLAPADDWKTERCEAFEADEGLAFFTHAFDSQRSTEVFQYAIDFKTGLVTCLISRLHNEKYPREPTKEWLFGCIDSNDEGFKAPTERHGFTDELVGRSFTWTYNDQMCGTCFGITHDQIFEYNTFGAESRSAGSIQRDIL